MADPSVDEVKSRTATPEIECVLDARATSGETPTWCESEQVLYWIDVEEPALHRSGPLRAACAPRALRSSRERPAADRPLDRKDDGNSPGGPRRRRLGPEPGRSPHRHVPDGQRPKRFGCRRGWAHARRAQSLHLRRLGLSNLGSRESVADRPGHRRADSGSHPSLGRSKRALIARAANRSCFAIAIVDNHATSGDGERCASAFRRRRLCRGCLGVDVQRHKDQCNRPRPAFCAKLALR